MSVVYSAALPPSLMVFSRVEVVTNSDRKIIFAPTNQPSFDAKYVLLHVFVVVFVRENGL